MWGRQVAKSSPAPQGWGNPWGRFLGTLVLTSAVTGWVVTLKQPGPLYFLHYQCVFSGFL